MPFVGTHNSYPTLAVYLDQDNKAEISRATLLETLITVVRHKDGRLSNEVKSILQGIQTQEVLVEVCKLSEAQRKELSHHLMQAALAVKLAIRTYKLT